MKIKINWKELGKQLWNAVKPVLLGAIGGGLVAVTGSGCSSLTPSAKTQTMSLYAIGIPGIAVVTHSTQDADNKGDDENFIGRPAFATAARVRLPRCPWQGYLV